MKRTSDLFKKIRALIDDKIVRPMQNVPDDNTGSVAQGAEILGAFDDAAEIYHLIPEMTPDLRRALVLWSMNMASAADKEIVQGWVNALGRNLRPAEG